MCLEVFVGSTQPLPDEGDELLVGDSHIPKDVARRMDGLNVVHVGASGTGCACGFLADDEEPAPPARNALIGYLEEAAGRQPIRLVVRWAGDSLRKTPTTTLPPTQLASLDLEIAWDHPQDILVRR